MAVQVVVSLLVDRATYQRGDLRKSLQAASASRRSMTPRAVGPAEGLQPARLPPRRPRHRRARRARGASELFGAEGTLNDKLARLGGLTARPWSTSTSSSSAPACPASAPATTCRPSARGRRYAIFEARDAIGGTWDLFRYPGIRSDSDMYTLGYSFRPWDGEKTIADGAVDPAVHQGHRGRGRASTSTSASTTGSSRADWSTADARWHVTAERTDTGETVELTAGFLFSCSGYYRYDHGYQPDFAGHGPLPGHGRPPAAWPEDLDYAGKRVVVIGSGATAITLIPSLADDGRARHDAAALADLHRVACPAKNPLAKLAPRACCPSAVAGADHPLGRSPSARRRPTSAQPAPARAGEAGAAQGRRAPAAQGLRHRHPLHAVATTRGTSASASVPDGDLFKAIQRRHGVGGHRPHRHASPRRASACESGERARGRHHRHRHRPRAAVHRRHRADRRRREGRRRRASSPTRG